MGLSLRASVKKTVHGMEAQRRFVKEYVLGAAVRREDHADSLLVNETTHHNDFLKKHMIVNRDSYFQFLNDHHIQ